MVHRFLCVRCQACLCLVTDEGIDPTSIPCKFNPVLTPYPPLYTLNPTSSSLRALNAGTDTVFMYTTLFSSM